MKARAVFVLARSCLLPMLLLQGPAAFDISCAAEKFALRRGDVVVFTGGEDMVASQKNGYLEMLLLLSRPGENIRFRNMSWEGDTVYDQPRELNFGSWSNQFRRVDATVVFAQFGQSESLQGQENLPQFIAAYEKLLNTFVAQARRVAILSPSPFEQPAWPAPDLALRNDNLASYVEAIRGLAERRGHAFVDLFTPLRKSSRRGTSASLRLTRDGMHLGSEGHWLAARETVRQLRLQGLESRIKMDARRGTLLPSPFEQLRLAIVEKNQLWFDYWRPMNWAFLHGDRIEQPSSRDHRNPKIRWFPEELEKFWHLIEARERETREQADTLSMRRE